MGVAVYKEHVVIAVNEDAVAVHEEAVPPGVEEIAVGVEDEHGGVFALVDVDPVLRVGGDVADVAVGPTFGEIAEGITDFPAVVSGAKDRLVGHSLASCGVGW